ncbi:MAG TPA: CBS domain-containing protein, partial [Polyangiaceae bacterium]|nr:CBS domain-containing protein [Polyangiaceae bacterium]
MTTPSTTARSCTIYRRHGETESHPLPAAPEHGPIVPATAAAQVELRHVMSRELVCARPDLDIDAVVGLMVQNHLGCIPVVDTDRRPIGMITKFDIVEQLHACLSSSGRGTPLPADLSPRSADEAMMPIALTLPETASLAHAASLMTCEDLHHVLVVSATGELVGVVSSKDIVTWLVRNDRMP